MKNKDSRNSSMFQEFRLFYDSQYLSLETYPQIPFFLTRFPQNLPAYSTSKSSLGSASSSTAVSMTPSVSVGRP